MISDLKLKYLVADYHLKEINLALYLFFLAPQHSVEQSEFFKFLCILCMQYFVCGKTFSYR